MLPVKPRGSMCRMLARVSAAESDVNYEFIDAPHSLLDQSQNGRLPEDPARRGAHNDGCGAAFLDEGVIDLTRRGAEDVWDESYREYAASIRTRAVIGHNRNASPELERTARCAHPFLLLDARTEPAAFCHNGTVRDFLPEAQARRTSDSEVYFHRLVADDRRIDPLRIAQRFRALAAAADYTSLTFFLLFPRGLIAARRFNDRSPKAADYDCYYTLFLKDDRERITLASEPIDEEPGWGLLPNNAILWVGWDQDGRPQRVEL
jgi:predicted glutamine amidotransferase